MKRIFGTVAFKIVALALSICLQIALYVLLFLFFADYSIWVSLFCVLLSMAAVIRIILKDGCPEYKIAWIVPIISFPIFGGVLYAVFGHSILSKREGRRISSISERYAVCRQKYMSSLSALEEESRTAAFQARYLENCADSVLYSNTAVQYFPVGEKMFDTMIFDLKKAEKFIFMEYFIVQEGEMWNTILSVLEEKAKAGVDVRFLFDDMGSMFTLPATFRADLEKKGIRCCAFNKFRHIFNSRFNNRDHRKICVIDGNVGYTGGINLADEYINRMKRFGHWKDTAVRLEGEGVYGLTCMFLSIWDYYYGVETDFEQYAPTVSLPSEGYILPFCTTPGIPETVGENMYINFINKARKYVYLMTPYLIIDQNLITALTVAAKSGIDVRIITPGIPDKKVIFFVTQSYYRVLLESGVKIYEYTSGFVHAKVAVSDDSTAVVGTINLDYRSLYLHHECAAWMYGTTCVTEIRDDFLDTQGKCKEITLKSIRKMSPFRRMWLAFLRIFAPLM